MEVTFAGLDRNIDKDIAILPGGLDVLGHPLVIFPVAFLHNLEETTANDVVGVIRYLVSRAGSLNHGQAIAVLVDLRHATRRCMETLITALDTAQAAAKMLDPSRTKPSEDVKYRMGVARNLKE